MQMQHVLTRQEVTAVHVTPVMPEMAALVQVIFLDDYHYAHNDLFWRLVSMSIKNPCFSNDDVFFRVDNGRHESTPSILCTYLYITSNGVSRNTKRVNYASQLS